MSIGAVSISTNAKKEIPGPPFASDSADNGLSVDGVSKKIVLGNDAGDPAQPAALLSNREIVTEDSIGNVFGITLRTILNNLTTFLDGTRIIITGGANTNPFFNMTCGNNCFPTITLLTGDNGASVLNLISGNASQSELHLATANDDFVLRADDTGLIKIIVAGITIGRIDANNQQWAVGSTSTNFSGADFSISGTATYRRFVSSKGAGAYNVNRDLDSSKFFTNSAANTFNLPDMSGGNNRSGFVFRLAINNVAGSTVQAAAGQTIRFGSLATSVAGTLTSTDVGASVTIVWTGSIWMTESFTGAWALT